MPLAGVIILPLTTLTTPQIPSHTHGLSILKVYGAPYSPANPAPRFGSATSQNLTSDGAGGGGSHDHPFSFSSGSGTFTGNAINLAVKYYDFIIASIN